MMDPTQVVTITLTGADGEEVVPAAGTVYRMSDEAGTFTEDMVLVVMTQREYNSMTPPGHRMGMATTGEILDELRARIEIDKYRGGGGLDYRTVDSDD